MDEARRITTVDEIPEDSSFLFTVRDGFDLAEAILIRLADGVVAVEISCPHWTDIRLDKGSGAEVRDDELVCTKHGATFERETGYCTYGPCEGATMAEIDVAVEDGVVYLTDDDYDFEQTGPSGEHDLSSRGRIGFSGN